MGGPSLVVQWLRLWAFTAGGNSSIPGRGTKISHAKWCGKIVEKKKKNTWAPISLGLKPQGNISSHLWVMPSKQKCPCERHTAVWWVRASALDGHFLPPPGGVGEQQCRGKSPDGH